MDNGQNYVQYTVEAQQTRPKKNEYTKYDTAVALILFPVAYAFVRLSGAAEYPLGRALCFALLFALSLVYMKKSGIALTDNPFAIIFGSAFLLLNIGLIFTSNDSVRFTISAATFFAYPYFVFALSGNSSEKRPSELFSLEIVKSLFVMTFGSIGAAFEAASSTKNGKKIWKTILMILAGLAVAFIPTIVVFYLLSYDEKFNEITDRLLDFGSFDLFSFVADLVVAVPLAVLIFGALYSGKNHLFADILSAEKCKKTSNAVRFAPMALVCSATAPFILLYSIFFVSQLDYYLSAFSGVLPERLTYADYAKNGFFQLCAVSVINLVIIIVISVFSKKSEERTPLLLKIVNALFSLLTLILIATVISKMVIYIGAYGLTVKRVLSSAFMIFLAVVFVLILIKQFLSRTNVILISLSAALLICGALAFSDVNGVIASYNTSRYLSGSLEHFEIGALYDLGDSGIIQLDRIARESEDEKARAVAENWLANIADSRKQDKASIFSLDIPALRAKAVLRKYGTEQ